MLIDAEFSKTNSTCGPLSTTVSKKLLCNKFILLLLKSDKQQIKINYEYLVKNKSQLLQMQTKLRKSKFDDDIEQFAQETISKLINFFNFF